MRSYQFTVIGKKLDAGQIAVMLETANPTLKLHSNTLTDTGMHGHVDTAYVGSDTVVLVSYYDNADLPLLNPKRVFAVWSGVVMSVSSMISSAGVLKDSVLI